MATLNALGGELESQLWSVVARRSADGIVGLPGISLIRQIESGVETPMWRKDSLPMDDARRGEW